MATLSFSMKDLAQLAEHAESVNEHTPTLGQQLDSSMWKEGTADLTDDEVFKNHGEHIDYAKVPAGFWLVKDHGIYLMSNGRPRQLHAGDSKRSVIVYANGFQPGRDADWFDKAVHAVGGDDFAEFIPLEWFKTVRAKGKSVLQVMVTPDDIELIS